ncbi:hypothetical protein [Wielerella bovis]|uniref:hypothetical protein n=1 Tax=Wielerella bovis TaxID=2917790 RepID=UPI00201907BC|nr:hypothetical protein [Wielerella bovis]MCG7657801.1 hypothetical protein [Wielerella bovis]MCG7660023.1 hypothetical protein [Wielerella bovis]
MDNSNKIAYLGFIQGAINRMGNNSFLVKGFAITLISALVATLDDKYCFIFIPTIMFWLLDTYYLHQERLFRKLYEKVIDGTEPDNSFSMNAQKYENEVSSFLNVMMSKTLSPFYGGLIIVLMIIM